MSFGESVFLAGFIHKTVRGTYMLEEITEFHHGKYVEDSRRLSTEAHL
jgi:hypothetical protein